MSVIHREVIERTYTDTCTVYEKTKYIKSNKTTSFKETVKYEALPCRLSFQSKSAAIITNTVSDISQSVRLFVSPEAVINPGSKITVTHDGRTTVYCMSGFPCVYSTHQEITLELWKDKA